MLWVLCSMFHVACFMKHIPVLLKEVIELLDPRPGEFFIDGTLGSGRHAAEILKKISPEGIFLGIDWDEEAIDRVGTELKAKSLRSRRRVGIPIPTLLVRNADQGVGAEAPGLKSFELIHGNYADLS